MSWAITISLPMEPSIFECALEPNAQAFSDKAKEHDCCWFPLAASVLRGWVRVSYCVSADVIRNSMPAFAALKRDYESGTGSHQGCHLRL